MKKSFLWPSLIISLFILFNGCAGGRYLTTRFQEVKSIPDGKALVYIYRPYKYVGCAVHYTVNANDIPVSNTHIYVKGYFIYYANPGKTKFSAEIAGLKSEIWVDIEQGKTYYIKGSVGMGKVVGRPIIEVVPEAYAIKEILKCRLLLTN